MAESSPLFGVLVSGQLVQTDFQRLTPTDFVVELRNTNNINHIAIFLSGIEAFPEGTAGSIYFRSSGNDSWHYLGMISNQKASAFFRVGNLKETGNHSNVFQMSNTMTELGLAQVGINVEPISDAMDRVGANSTAVSSQTVFAEFQEKSIRNLINYVESFAKYMATPENPSRREYFVPIAKISQWYENFKNRLSIDPNFWKTLNAE